MPDDHLEPLRRIARSIARSDMSTAERDLRHLLREVEQRRDSVAVTSYVFGAALAARLSSAVAEEANLYVRHFDVPQIHLFNLLAGLPFVGLTSVIANRCIVDAIRGKERAIVIDVGIGTGRQMSALLESVSAAGDAPKLTIVGIEPADWALDLAEKNVLDLAKRLRLDVSFHRFCNVAENLTRADWSRLAGLATERPVVNASFALHHISDVDGRDVRDDVLLRLRSLNPALLVLSEPNVDHREPDFMQRFENCLAHFGEVFESIDALPFEARDKDALKACFFGREIVDILGGAEGSRSERHESTAQWRDRLVRAGYGVGIDISLPAAGPVIRATRHDGHVSLDFKTALTAVIGARPVDGSFDVQGALARAPVDASRPRVEKPIDIRFYLDALSTVAHADGVVHPSEREFIDEQARLFGVPPPSPASMHDVLSRASSVDHTTREAILRDLVFLARIDDHYTPDERRIIAAIAERLGFSAAELSQLESRDVVPPILAGGPSWMRKLWFLGFKRELAS